MILHLKHFLIFGILFCFTSSTWAIEKPADSFTAALHLKSDIPNGKAEFQKRCAQCHGDNAYGSYDGEFPQLAGQHRSVILKQLADIHSGIRTNPNMLPIVYALSLEKPQLIADIAGFLEASLMNPEPEIGFGEDLELAESVYQSQCAECHGSEGEGESSKFYPLVQGQHYEYLLRELKWLRDGKRKNANKEMVEQIKDMTDKQLDSLADYLSRLMPPGERLGEAE